MQAIFDAADLVGVGADARMFLLAMVAICLSVACVVVIKSILLGGSHFTAADDERSERD